jgi:hypothetical protein
MSNIGAAVGDGAVGALANTLKAHANILLQMLFVALASGFGLAVAAPALALPRYLPPGSSELQLNDNIAQLQQVLLASKRLEPIVGKTNAFMLPDNLPAGEYPLTIRANDGSEQRTASGLVILPGRAGERSANSYESNAALLVFAPERYNQILSSSDAQQ